LEDSADTVAVEFWRVGERFKGCDSMGFGAGDLTLI